MMTNSTLFSPIDAPQQIPGQPVPENRSSPETPAAQPEYLSIDRIFSKLLQMKIVDETGNITAMHLLQKPLPQFSEVHLNQFKDFFRQEVEISGARGLPLLNLFYFFSDEAKTFKQQIPDIIVSGWSAWHLLEKWGYLDAAISEIDSDILQMHKASNSDPSLPSTIDMIVYLKGTIDWFFIKKGLEHQFLEWQLKHPHASNFQQERISFSFDEYWTEQGFLHCLLLSLKIHNGPCLTVRIVSQGNQETPPFPVAISLRRISDEKILSKALLCKPDLFWQCVVDYLIGSQNSSPQGVNPDESWLFKLRNISKGYLPPCSSPKEQNHDANMIEASFSKVKPADSNEIFITAFQLCLYHPLEDQANKKIWSNARESIKKYFPSENSTNQTELFFLIAKLIVDEKVPFERILAVFQFAGRLHFHTNTVSGDEDQKVNFRLTRWNQSLAFRVSFKTPSGNTSYIFFDCHPDETVPIKTIREDQKKVILVLDKLLPANPIDANRLTSGEPRLSQMAFRTDFKNPQAPSHEKLYLEHHFQMYVKCFDVLRNEKLTYLMCLFDFLEEIFCSPMSATSRKFIICSLNMKLSQLYGSDKLLENGLKKYMDGTCFSKTEFLEILLDAISSSGGPLLLTSYKNYWRKQVVKGSQMNEAFWDLGQKLNAVLIENSLVIDAISLMEFLYKQDKINAIQSLALLSKLGEKAKRIPQSPELLSCYSQAGSLIHRIFDKIPTSDADQSIDFSVDAFHWILLQLLQTSQMEVVVDILACAANKNIVINSTTLFEMLNEWKLDTEFLVHLPELKKRLSELHTGEGDRLAQACNVSTADNHQQSQEEIIQTQLQQPLPYSISLIRYFFKSLVQLQQSEQEELKLKIVLVLIKNCAGNRLVSGKHSAEMQNLYRENVRYLLLHLQRANLFHDMANLFLQLSNDIPWTESLESYALWCIERHLESQSGSNSILLAHKIMTMIQAKMTATQANVKARILCKLSNALFAIDRQHSLLWARELSSISLDVLWDTNAVSEVQLCSQRCAIEFLDISTASQLIKRLIDTHFQKEIFFKFWLGIYETLNDGQHLFQCFDILIAAKTLFLDIEYFTPFEVCAKQLIEPFPAEQEFEEVGVRKLQELLLAYGMTDGKVWHITLHNALKLKSDTKTSVMFAWFAFDTSNRIVYSQPQEREYCWNSFLNHFSVNKAFILMLIPQKSHLRTIFNDPMPAYKKIMLQALHTLGNIGSEKILKPLLLELVEFRNDCLEQPQTLNPDVDIRLAHLLASHPDAELLQKGLELYERLLVSNGIQSYSSLCTSFYSFFDLIVSNPQNQGAKNCQDKIISITAHLRTHAANNMMHFDYAEKLSKMESTHAYAESAEMALAGIEQLELKKPATPLVERLYVLMEVLVDNIANGANPDTIASCLQHKQFPLHIPDRIAYPLWLKLIMNTLKIKTYDPNITSKELYKWCVFAAINAQRILYDPSAFQDCFDLIIESNLKFLQNFRDLSKFKSLHAYSSDALKPHTLVIGSTANQMAEAAFVPINLKIVMEYLNAIDHQLITDDSHIDELYGATVTIMFNLRHFMSVKKMTIIYQSALLYFCYWTSPIKSQQTQKHLPLTLKLCAKYLNKGLSQVYPEAAKKLIETVVLNFLHFQDTYPAEYAVTIDCSRRIQEILIHLIDTDLIDKTKLKEWIIRIFFLSPFVISSSSTTSKTLLTTLSGHLNQALEKQILDSDTYNYLSWYLQINENHPKEESFYLSVFDFILSYPTYFSALRGFWLLQNDSHLNIQTISQCLKKLEQMINFLPKESNHYSLFYTLCNKSVSFAEAYPKLEAHHPIISLLFERSIAYCLQSPPSSQCTAYVRSFKYVLELCKLRVFDNHPQRLQVMITKLKETLPEVDASDIKKDDRITLEDINITFSEYLK